MSELLNENQSLSCYSSLWYSSSSFFILVKSVNLMTTRLFPWLNSLCFRCFFVTFSTFVPWMQPELQSFSFLPQGKTAGSAGSGSLHTERPRPHRAPTSAPTYEQFLPHLFLMCVAKIKIKKKIFRAQTKSIVRTRGEIPSWVQFHHFLVALLNVSNWFCFCDQFKPVYIECGFNHMVLQDEWTLNSGCSCDFPSIPALTQRVDLCDAVIVDLNGVTLTVSVFTCSRAAVCSLLSVLYCH